MKRRTEIDLSASSVECAQRLLGCELVREVNGQLLRGIIVETEAYDQTDEASHSFRGVTPRTAIMFGPPGFAYVYFTYGMHYCMNVVTGEQGEGSAVLIRALEPLEGTAMMEQNRNTKTPTQLTNGPAKLCQAFMIDRDLNGHNLAHSPLQLIAHAPIPQSNIVPATRIGISRDSHRPWRFYIKDNLYVSKL
jgi:DNA-3-methyladenine glycosylase